MKCFEQESTLSKRDWKIIYQTLQAYFLRLKKELGFPFGSEENKKNTLNEFEMLIKKVEKQL
jgi:hypothetical protein|tara:strand:+ start:1524 stop:1709 length:186 start_codon:yes stop_codon:yes gene_type:complete